MNVVVEPGKHMWFCKLHNYGKRGKCERLETIMWLSLVGKLWINKSYENNN